MNAALRSRLFVIALGTSLASGCLTSKPPAVKPPSVNSSAGADAVKSADTNGDGALDATELAAKIPGILGATGKDLPKWDTNSDSKVSADEITARIHDWFKNGTGLMTFSCLVKLDGQPLADADVVFETEPFLGTDIKPCSGKTGANGSVVLAIKLDDLPPADRIPGAVRPGLYKVKITHASKTIPERYNTATTLGQEITPNNIENEQTTFELSSR